MPQTPQRSEPTISRLIEIQRRLTCSSNPFIRRFGPLLASAVLDSRLARLTDREVGQLVIDYVERDLGIGKPETTICRQATQRLFRSTGGSLEPEEIKERVGCPQCGSEMLLRINIEEPDALECSSLACGLRIEESIA